MSCNVYLKTAWGTVTVLNAVQQMLMYTQLSTPIKHVMFNYLDEDFSVKHLTQDDLKNLFKENLSTK